MKQALIIAGGWEGHKPQEMASRFAAELPRHQIEPRVESDLGILQEARLLAEFDLIIPCWTMGRLEGDAEKNLSAAVKQGTGLAGIHGGMGDAFRGSLEYEWMTGGHFLGHPHVGTYTVRLTPAEHPLLEGLPAEFSYDSEQYYMMVDPAITVLAEATYVWEGRGINMPVAWIRRWGKGRVFYSSLGHDPVEFDRCPPAWEMIVRGLLWSIR